MSALADRQTAFATALLNPAIDAPFGLIDPDGRPAGRRFSVYRNNVMVSLIETLKAAYPVVLSLVGEDFFTALAVFHIRRSPPASPMLILYGDGFARSIEAFEEAESPPYLADVARIERAWLESYHSADAPSLDLTCLTAVPAERFADLMLVPHPSVRTVRSEWLSLTIWAMHVEGPLQPVDAAAGGEDALICRPGAEVFVRSLPPGSFDFLAALARGASVGQAADEALDRTPGFDLASGLVGLLEAGAFISPLKDAHR